MIARTFILPLAAGCCLLLSAWARASAPSSNDVPGAASAEALPAGMPEPMRKRLASLPPDQRRKMVKRWHDLQKLSPESRRKIERDFQIFSKMTPQQREEMRKQYRQFESMTPQQRQKLVENWKRWEQLSPQEREKLRKQMGARKPPPPANKGAQPDTNGVAQAIPASTDGR